AGLWRGQEIIVLFEPEVEISVWIELPNRLAEKPFEPVQIFVDFRQLLARIGEEVLDVEIRVMLPHIDSEGRAVAAAGKTKNVLLWQSDCSYHVFLSGALSTIALSHSSLPLCVPSPPEIQRSIRFMSGRSAKRRRKCGSSRSK